MQSRWIIKNIIDKEEESIVLKEFGFGRVKLKNAIKNPVILKILNRIRQEVTFELSDESYFKVENYLYGHDWHCDTGDRNQMPWCTIGATILLSGEHTGGELSYKNPLGYDDMIHDRKVYDLYFHTSDVFHKVEKSSGDRKVLLLFI